ncbi:MAG TPA: YqaE/Pmp3 family membrane protein [Bacteroidia bacterium]|jgi:uncharacterized membrane protein YqaE (UPF0057 family)|nr:YqaE/Pmp3 family membrane protein [Bacteroidia bacterium]
MKKIFQQLLVLTASTVLLSSCANISKLSLTKRHYRSGYFVDFGSSKHITPITVIHRKPQNETLTPVTAKSAQPVVTTAAIIATNEVNTAPSNIVPKTKKVNAAKIASANATAHVALAITASPTTYAKDESDLDHHTQVDVNVSFVVIVLCAIFIPPLGVALMYGITTYFWIDLILTLLFFFPGMIFALIVVLS